MAGRGAAIAWRGLLSTEEAGAGGACLSCARCPPQSAQKGQIRLVTGSGFYISLQKDEASEHSGCSCSLHARSRHGASLPPRQVQSCCLSVDCDAVCCRPRGMPGWLPAGQVASRSGRILRSLVLYQPLLYSPALRSVPNSCKVEGYGLHTVACLCCAGGRHLRKSERETIARQEQVSFVLTARVAIGYTACCRHAEAAAPQSDVMIEGYEALHHVNA